MYIKVTNKSPYCTATSVVGCVGQQYESQRSSAVDINEQSTSAVDTNIINTVSSANSRPKSTVPVSSAASCSQSADLTQHCNLSQSYSLLSSQHSTTSHAQHTDTPFSSQLTDSQPTDNHSSDQDYDPELDSNLDSDTEWERTKTGDKTVELEDIPKYLVFETELDKLFTTCLRPGCHSPITKLTKLTTGSMLSVTTTCSHYHTDTWHSQPSVRRMPAGNLLLSAAILLSGSTYTKTHRFTDLLCMPILCESEFDNIQNTYLFPTVNDYWTMHQDAILSVLAPDELRVGGDARSDSPGFSAKYTSYTIMDLKTSLILDQQLVVKTETANNSVAMEKEGLDRCLQFLDSRKIKIHTLATDRHVGVQSLLKEEYPKINHQFDVWHVKKNVCKKLHKKAQKKGATELLDWENCIGNHLYWCASTCGGNAKLLREKWLSCVHHVVDCHEWNGELLEQCEHGTLDGDYEWLTEDSEAHKALRSVVQDKRLLKDLGKLTDCCLTGSLESYHSLILSYAPKRLHFPYAGQQTRLQLAALDHNHNVDRDLVRDSAGNPIVRLVFSKARKDWFVRNVYESKTYNYLFEILHKIMERRADESIRMKDPSCRLSLPPLKRNLATKEKPDLQLALAKHLKRVPDTKS